MADQVPGALCDRPELRVALAGRPGGRQKSSPSPQRRITRHDDHSAGSNGALIVLASCVPTIITGAVAADHRVPWTSSKIAGTPDPPPPYTVEPAFPDLKFEFPVALVKAQGTRRLFLGDLRGRVYSFADDPGCKKADLALELGKVYPDLSALYGLTFHPDFDKNRFVYVCYVRKNDVPDGSVVSRSRRLEPTHP